VSRNKPIPQIPRSRQAQETPRQPNPTEIAKNNLMQSMNSVGSVANNLLQAEARYMGISVMQESTLDHAIDLAQMFVFKMNAITQRELELIDEQIAEEAKEAEEAGGTDPEPAEPEKKEVPN